jgi:hypothetical protein
MCHLWFNREGRLTLEAKSTFGWFRVTHQLWKYWLFVVLAITGGIGVWIGIWIFLAPETDVLLGAGVVMLSSGLVFSVLFWFFLSVRCPACGMRVAYRIFARTQYRDLYNRLRNMQACSGCGKG